jgi:mRNA interferase RelE/StbE
MYSIEFSDLSKKQFLKLPKDVQRRIKYSLQRIRIRPFSFVKRLVGYNSCSLRVGDYRIILDINKKEVTILVIEIGHRKKIYKK